MNTKAFNKNRIFFITSLLILGIICCFFSIKTFSANAQTQIEATLYHPNTAMEYKSLTSPIDAFYWEDKIAIIQGSDNKLLVYNDGEYTEKSFTSLQQVKLFDSDYLIVSYDGSYHKINFNDLNDIVDLSIGGNYFDLNDDYLVSAYGSTITIYDLSDETFTTKVELTERIKPSTPVYINEHNRIFYVHNDKLCTCTVSDTTEIELSDQMPTSIIADTDFVYYTVANNVYKKSLTNLTSQEILLIIEDDHDYDLGKLTSPESLSFKNGNLLITDSNENAVQEFSIDHENNKLIFTGFAVAKGKTAFNRISPSSKEIEQQNGKIAILDSLKLTIISNSTDGKSFTNYLIADLGIVPNLFALGTTTAFITENGNSFVTIDTLTNSVSQKLSVGNLGDVITDVAYNDGVYYLMVKSGSNTSIYSLLENNDVPVNLQLNTSPTIDGNPLLTVDVEGNVYMTDDTTDSVIKFSKLEDGTIDPTPIGIVGLDASNAKELYTDLACGLFVLKNDDILYHYNGTTETYTLDVPYTSNISAMSMNFDKDQVCFIFENEETIYTTTSLPNVSIEDVKKTADYKITDQNANIENLKIYTVTDGANVYSVIADNDKFNHLELIDGKDKEFVLICDYQISDLTFSILAGESDGKNVEVIVNKKHLIEKSDVILDAQRETAFVTTDVSMYFLPLITKNDTYCLTLNDAVVRIQNKTQIYTQKIITFIDNDFYFASVTIGDETFTGYIPVNFTVHTLSENVLNVNFTYGKISKTAIYSNAELTDKILDVEDEIQVKIYSNENGVACIGVQTDDGEVIGYVSSDAIKETPNTVIRNILIILAVTLSITVTSIYFVLKKKN